jgi:hypothetical protein
MTQQYVDAQETVRRAGSARPKEGARRGGAEGSRPSLSMRSTGGGGGAIFNKHHVILVVRPARTYHEERNYKDTIIEWESQTVCRERSWSMELCANI